MERNKLTTYLLYAFGEIFLVVIGILIAVSLNNLNEQKKHSQQEQKILRSLSEELSYNIQVFDSINYYHLQQIGAIYALRDSDLTTYSLEEFDSLFFTAFSFYTYDPSEGVINSLVSSGNIDLLADEVLKYRIAKLGDIVEDYREDQDIIASYVLTQVLPRLSDQMDIDYGYFYLKKERNQLQKQKDAADYLNVFRNRILRNQLNIIGALVMGGPLQEGPAMRSELVALRDLANEQIIDNK